MTNRAQTHIREIVAQQHIPLTDRARMAHAANQGMVMGINDAFYFATILTVISLVLSFFIRNRPPREDPITIR